MGPTAAFAYKLPYDTYPGNYYIISKGQMIAPSQKVIQVRYTPVPPQDNQTDQDLSAQLEAKIVIFNQNFAADEPVYGKV